MAQQRLEHDAQRHRQPRDASDADLAATPPQPPEQERDPHEGDDHPDEEDAPPPAVEQQSVPQQRPTEPQPARVPADHDLDIPAFLRRR